MSSSASSPQAVVDATPRSAIQTAQAAVATVVRGKDQVIERALVALIAGGHLLIEDLPGVGKSTLARALAAAVGGAFTRVQFTSDLLPADIVGVNVWRPQKESFTFEPGPIFANFVLADEINRAPPRTQSALLEAMGERQVSVDGQSHELPRPFMVLATQNPTEHHGTYPLPESQRDRFALRVEVGYADAEVEAALLQAKGHPGDTQGLEAATTPQAVEQAQTEAAALWIHPDLAAYAQRVVQATREHPDLRLGVSTRGALAWVATARAAAWLAGRDHVTIDDLQDLAADALAHRLVPAAAPGEGSVALASTLLSELMAATPVPR